MKLYLMFCFIPFLSAQSSWDRLIYSRQNRDLMILKVEQPYKRNCQWEKDYQQFPKNCFKDFMDQLRQLGSSADLKRMRNQLEQNCLATYQKLGEIKEVQTLLKQYPLGSRCRKKIKQQLKDLQYQQGQEVGSSFEIKTEYEPSVSKKSLL